MKECSSCHRVLKAFAGFDCPYCGGEIEIRPAKLRESPDTVAREICKALNLPPRTIKFTISYDFNDPAGGGVLVECEHVAEVDGETLALLRRGTLVMEEPTRIKSLENNFHDVASAVRKSMEKNACTVEGSSPLKENANESTSN